MMHVIQIMLYTLSLHSAVCQLYLNNTGKIVLVILGPVSFHKI